MIRRRRPRRKGDKFEAMRDAPGALLPAPPAKRPNVKATIPERDLQAMAENLCIALGIRFFRLPDSLLGYLARCPDAWIRVFNSRYLAGFPDLALFKRRPEGGNEVRFIEIKTEAGKIHQAQSKWHSGLDVIVCYGWEQTEKAIKGFL